MTSFCLFCHTSPTTLSSLSQPCQELSIAVQLLSSTDTFICGKAISVIQQIIGDPMFRTGAHISSWASHLMLHAYLTRPSFSAPSPSLKICVPMSLVCLLL